MENIFRNLNEVLTAGGATAAASATTKLHLGFDHKTHGRHVHGHGRRLRVKLLLHDELVAVVLHHLVGIGWLIQSQGKTRAASATSEIDTDGGDFLILEIVVDLLFGSLGKRNHLDLHVLG